MERPRSWALLRGGALGDFVLATPALAALREEADHVELWCSPRYAEPWAHLADRVVDLRGTEALWLYGGPPPGRPAPEAALCCTPGAAEGLRRWGVRQIHCVAPRPPWPGPHAAEHIFAPLAALGLRPRPAPPRVDPGALAGVYLLEKPFVVAPGAPPPEKVWAGFARLAERLPEERLLWAPGRDEAWSTPARGRSLPGLGLPGLVALAQGAAAWVGNDTGTTHLAAAAAPGRVLALFGPTRPETWGPAGARSVAFADVDDVYAELTRILNRGRADRAGPE